ncbi:MAG: Gfo/Idh/MocA family protein [Planctomycetota bacterium]
MSKINALVVGTGEYVTGFVSGAASGSDKSAGVIGLSLFDLRRRGLIDRIALAGTNGSKFPGVREHFARAIEGRYAGLDARFDSYPADDVTGDREAYRHALETLDRDEVVLVFTPDDTHFEIAMQAVNRGCHVLVAKPIVKTIDEHRRLVAAAEREGVIVAMEVHKRWDPIYADARDRIRNLGDASYFVSYMSQPKSQLDTFAAWAGQASDISYYLNAHHVDFSTWALAGKARPISVHASASEGVAKGKGVDTEDTITLTVNWQNLVSGNLATAVYTASWIAPTSDAHSQQRFFYAGHDGEVSVDQAHRGYGVATDTGGFVSPNPLFMKYEPDGAGRFAGRGAYGYRSIEAFIEAVVKVRQDGITSDEAGGGLALASDTITTTAILEAGRRSLDAGGANVRIEYDTAGSVVGLALFD